MRKLVLAFLSFVAISINGCVSGVWNPFGPSDDDVNGTPVMPSDSITKPIDPSQPDNGSNLPSEEDSAPSGSDKWQNDGDDLDL